MVNFSRAFRFCVVSLCSRNNRRKGLKESRLASIVRDADSSGSISSSGQCGKNSSTCTAVQAESSKGAAHPEHRHFTMGLTSSQSKRLMSLPHSRWSLYAMQMSGAELETVPSSVFRFSFWKKKVWNCSKFLFSHHVKLDDHWRTNLKVIVGAAERRLD